MSNQLPLSIVIFGATGNLYADKLAKALFLLFQEGRMLPRDFKVLAFARKAFTDGDFRKLTKEHILKRGEVDALQLDEFLTHIEYIQGDFSNVDDFKKLKDILIRDGDRLTIFHLATPSFLYETIFNNLHSARLHELGGGVRLMIEKPFGKNKIDAEHLRDILAESFSDDEQIFNIDHYVAKETVRSIPHFRFVDGSLESIWDSEHISHVRVAFHESNIVGSRGATYDSVGAFRDVGQNHMLQLLALVIMRKPKDASAHSVRTARAEALKHVYVNDAKPVTKGQYEGYLSSSGVDAGSKSETFFRIFLKSEDPRFSNIDFELESGKGLIDLKSEITTTTVGVVVQFKNGDIKEFKIQPVLGTMYESYSKVYMDTIRGDQTLFISMDEILTEWRLADELLETWKDIPLVIYKQGTAPSQIK